MIKNDKLKNILFLVVCIFLTRQVPLKIYSWIMNVALILIFVLEYKNFMKKKLFIFNFIWSSILLCYSILRFNNIFLCIKFYTIILLLNTIFFLKPQKNYIKIFNVCIYFQIFLLIIFEIYMIKNFNLKNYLNVRLLFLENGWGDVYTYSGKFWKIQILGNGLIPFSLFLSYFLLENKKNFFKYSVLLINLIGIIIAGNFAYIISVIYYFVGIFYYSKIKKHLKICLAVLSFLFYIFFLQEYIYNQIQMKKESSNAIKKDQAIVLIKNLDTPKDIILGKGLGNKIKVKTKYRDYSNHIYYELQSLYFFNQLGILNSIIFVGIHIFLIFKYIREKKIIHVYISYLISGLFNPYILDTNHIVVLFILVALKNKRESELWEKKFVQ